jgi:hypothetical protein
MIVRGLVERDAGKRGVLLAFDALRERVEQPVIALHETEGLPVLDDAKAIETIAFGIEEELLAEKL